MTRIDRKKALAHGCALALALAAGSARADSSGMEWLGIVYVWGADIEVDARDRTLDVAFSDTVDNLEMGFQGHVEAQAEDFGGFVDVVFMGVGTNDVQQGIRVQHGCRHDGDGPRVRLEPGLATDSPASRSTAACATSTPTSASSSIRSRRDPPVLQTGIDKSYYDLLVGARYAAPLNEHWRLVFSGDLSGGDTEGTWSLGAFGVYRTGPHRFYARLPARRNGVQRSCWRDRHRDLFRACNRVRIRLLTEARKQLKNKQKAGLF